MLFEISGFSFQVWEIGCWAKFCLVDCPFLKCLTFLTTCSSCFIFLGWYDFAMNSLLVLPTSSSVSIPFEMWLNTWNKVVRNVRILLNSWTLDKNEQIVAQLIYWSTLLFFPQLLFFLEGFDFHKKSRYTIGLMSSSQTQFSFLGCFTFISCFTFLSY